MDILKAVGRPVVISVLTGALEFFRVYATTTPHYDLQASLVAGGYVLCSAALAQLSATGAVLQYQNVKAASAAKLAA